MGLCVTAGVSATDKTGIASMILGTIYTNDGVIDQGEVANKYQNPAHGTQ